MINRVFSKEGIVLIGGVAKNQCMLIVLKEQLDLRILIPDDS
jgi:activator of 2-hydroxyglutaryl-CoA dehydratase